MRIIKNTFKGRTCRNLGIHHHHHHSGHNPGRVGHRQIRDRRQPTLLQLLNRQRGHLLDAKEQPERDGQLDEPVRALQWAEIVLLLVRLHRALRPQEVERAPRL